MDESFGRVRKGKQGEYEKKIKDLGRKKKDLRWRRRDNERMMEADSRTFGKDERFGRERKE